MWLGLTVGCCQCHTHKFDPIQHREYYELFAFFNSGTDINNRGATIPVTRGEMFGRPVTPRRSRSAPSCRGVGGIGRSASWPDWRSSPSKQDAAAAQWSPAKYVELRHGIGCRLRIA